MNTYDKDWDSYAQLIFDRKDSPEWEVLRKARETHFNDFFQINKDDNILDAGCGHGEYTIFSLKRNAKMWAFDYSKEMVNCTRELVKKHNLKAEAITVDSVTNIPYDDNYFDVVYCLAVLDHLDFDNREKAYKELNRVLKKGGKLILDVPNRFAFHWRFIFLIMRIFKLYPQGDIHFFTPFEINKILKKYDFQKVKSLGLTILPPFSGIYTTDLRRITFLPNFLIKILDIIYLKIEINFRRISFFKPICWHYFVEAIKK
ncbi:MAG: class I SAM-dependent methyltransferase [Bacteroidota bacterium]